MSRYALSCDIGGTFTDVVLYDRIAKATRYVKVPTNVSEPAKGALEGIHLILNQDSTIASNLGYVIHGTTLVANSIIERKGAKTALITTKGFRDILEIGRERRYDAYDLYATFPEPLVPRRLRFEVDERLWRNGAALKEVDLPTLAGIIDDLEAARVESVAICLLHSYRDPTHETQVAEEIRARLPKIVVSASNELVRKPGEYERTSTTVLNAFVKPRVQDYTRTLNNGLSSIGLEGRLHYMLSTGGIGTVQTVATSPIQLIESGAAGGAVIAAHIGRALGKSNILGFDMGGTTAKICVIHDGKLVRTSTFEAARVSRFQRGSGLPIQVPVLDLLEIGAGGGSIASVNSMGLLEVGPESAGSEPGPAAYGRGGQQPTCTDASVALGYYDPQAFAGIMRLDIQAARTAIESQIARQLDVSVERAAWGIHDLVTENMASAVRMYLSESGYQASEFALVVFGGAGPTYACDLAERVGISEILVPSQAGVASAMGFLAAPFAIDLTGSCRKPLDDVVARQLSHLFSEMEVEGRDVLGSVANEEDIAVQRFVEMRYVGQSAEDLEVDVSNSGSFTREQLEIAFNEEYERLYGECYPDLGLEVLDCRLVVSAIREPFFVEASADSRQVASVTSRAAYSPHSGKLSPHAVHAREYLSVKSSTAGPAIVEGGGSTIVVREGWAATVGLGDVLKLDRAEGSTVSSPRLEGANHEA